MARIRQREGRGWRSRGAATRLLALPVLVLLGLQFVPLAAAHDGTTHAGTPHWLLLAVVLVGLGLTAWTVIVLRRTNASRRASVLGLLSGLALSTFGIIGLVEVQLEATTDPSTTLLLLHPVASYAIGFGVVLGSQIVTLRYWPGRPRYSVLGALLGAWILYPVLMPNGGITHPMGYGLVLALPLTVGYVLWRDAGTAIRALLADRFTAGVAGVATLAIWIFLSFSAGTLTLVPETTGVPDEPFLVSIGVADPLVLWPALELYLPSIPLFAMISVGTILLFGTLSTLLGINVALVARELRDQEGSLSPGFLLGTVSTTGATACGCCAPAMYGVLSATLGASATPIYWSFMDTSSPLSATFLAASVLLLVGSVVRSAATTEQRPPTPAAVED